jgi:hypothetical protein
LVVKTWVCKRTRTLRQDAVNHVRVPVPETFTGVQQREKPAAVDAALTVDVYGFTFWVLKEFIHRLLKEIVPIQNVRVK